MVLPQFLLPILLLRCAQGKPNGVEKKILAIVAMPLPKMKKKKKICFGNCGNGIAENVKKKKKVLAIVAMPLPKMEKKKICFGNCGNAITDNVKKKKKKKNYFYNCGHPIAENGKKNYEWVKKKVVTSTIFLQYFHNKSHVINYY